jgi:hypothetical protein
VEQGLENMGCADEVSGRRKFVERLDMRAIEEAQPGKSDVMAAETVDKRRSDLRRGWYWGSQAFAERMLALSRAIVKKPRHRNYRASEESKEHGEREALRILAEGLCEAGLNQEELVRLKGSDARKVRIAKRIKEQTTVKLSWIAERLEMKSATNVSQQLSREKRKST